MPMSPKAARRFLFIPDVQSETGLSRDAIARLFALRELTPIRVPGRGTHAKRILISRSDLEAAIDRWKRDGAP